MYNQMDRVRPRTANNWERYFCYRNFKKYLLDTTLHGLRFVGDDNLTIWERLFFLCAFIAAVCTTAYLISFIYAKWESTPIIIGIDPFPVAISEIPFPTVTICNMNQLLRSKVANYNDTSYERALMDMACFYEAFKKDDEMPDHYKHNNLSIQSFLVEHAQPCRSLIKDCVFSSQRYTCSDLFREVITDEGLCCVFNLLHPKNRYKNTFKVVRDYTNTDGAIPVDWNPEKGYPKKLPEKYYPRPARGIGVTMGLSITLNAEVTDYFCSSTNGAGFKISLSSPIEAPRVNDIGFTIGVGEETRLRIEAHASSAASSTRALHPHARLCLFGDESKELSFYKFYTRRNCENECQARYIHRACQCIPYNLPLIHPNATICGAPDILCKNNAAITWLRAKGGPCREKCYSSCFDLTFSASAYSAPLVEGTYMVQNEDILRNINRTYARQNIAIVHFYYSEFIFHGQVRNIYVGFTDFLSNTGGILGLFLGFSFISLAEAFYYAFIRPIFWWKRPMSSKVAVAANQQIGGNKVQARLKPASPHWLGHKIFRARRKIILRASPLPDFLKDAKRETFLTGLTLKSSKELIDQRKTPWKLA